MDLYQALTEYTSSGAYPFHMPGHKRRMGFLCEPVSIDITEIDGFDDLHHADGIIRQAEERAAALYHSSETHFLVNGSTAGILSAIGACSCDGGILLMARNSHRSAYHAAALHGLKTEYLYPVSDGDLNGPVLGSDVERALAQNSSGICAVFLTSPTYDGIVSDVKSIAGIAHRYNVPLIVDEAHGAHFGMHPLFPESSVTLGADFVIHSLHKTLPSLTQTALIHVNGPIADRIRLRRMLSIFQTSSPSYVLMASIDRCIRLLDSSGPGLFASYVKLLEDFYRKCRFSSFHLIRTDDPSRILIRPYRMTALELYSVLRERFLLQPEMVTASYVLMLSGVADEKEGFDRLLDALRILDEESARSSPQEPAGSTCEPTDPDNLYGQPDSDSSVRQPDVNSSVRQPDSDSSVRQPDSGCLYRQPDPGCFCGHNSRQAHNIFSEVPRTMIPRVCYSIKEAWRADQEAVSFPRSVGRISAEFLYMYPPGTPLLAPGEEISSLLIRHVLSLKEAGYTFQGTQDHSLETIRVLKESAAI